MAQWKSACLETEGPRVLASPESLKTRPYITERLLMGRKESNQTNKDALIGEFNFHSAHRIISTSGLFQGK